MCNCDLKTRCAVAEFVASSDALVVSHNGKIYFPEKKQYLHVAHVRAMCLFASRVGQVVPVDVLKQYVWGNKEVSDPTVRGLIATLRLIARGSGRNLYTERGKGYLLVEAE
ncbi:Transcriptional regulatory protein, C terminal [Ferrimonas marina]|uniref:Transcriptional regulatory protein, C terminal n=2 Tax=Ferrimonas marina TaxID=299255 RepID=A0A1M5UGE5_9GAMM|nr:Transcriptional regulatory protein, C terminal [Ferrimonas marina]